MAQATWVPSSGRRSALDSSMVSPNHPQPLDLARWELAEFLKSNMSRDSPHPQPQDMYHQPDMDHVFSTFGSPSDGMISNAQAPHTDSHSPISGRPESVNGAGQSYDVFPQHPSPPAAYHRPGPSSASNYGLVASNVYGNGSINDSQSAFTTNVQSFTVPTTSPSLYPHGKLSSEHANGTQRSHDFSYPTMHHGNGSSSLSDLRRVSSTSSYRSDFSEDFASVTSNLGMGISSLNMQSQPQFTEGYGRFQPDNQYTTNNAQTSVHFRRAPSHSDASQSHNAFSRSQSYDGMSNYMGTMMNNGSPSAVHANGTVENSVTTQSKVSIPSNGVNDIRTLIRPYVDQYVRTPNRLGFGERTVIVMSSKVAQKSYGNEKRFLCPPPTAVMVGNAWWTDVHRPGEGAKLTPPRVIISISGEPAPQESSVEWAGAAGKPFDASDPPTGTTYVGRCVGKQLYISEADEKRKKVEALVKITAFSSKDVENVVGIFPSKPIKVISKPSKKRQSAKNLELCINHGSTVSLFHRLRSQTVSTKYLCVSASGSSFKGSDGAPLMGTDVRSRPATPAFVARTSSWDPFIMYIVDVNKPPGVTDAPPPPALQPDYPSPPPNAISFPNNGSQIPIYYNQTIVLQCLTSGVVSPILIIRKVDHQTTVVGGGNQEGGKNVPDHYCAPGEVYGDPVSQLHKIAFEVYEPNKPLPESGSPGVSGAFLSCMAEKVNTYRPVDGRQWSPSLSRGSDSPGIPSSPSATSSASGDYFTLDGNVPPSPGVDEIPSTNDGGRVMKKGKRSTSSAGGITKNSASKARKRPNSAGSTGSRRPVATDSAGGASSGALWQVDIGETSVWTIVGTEQIRYDFYVPPVLFGQGGVSQTNSFPVPTSPVTPFPGVVKYLPPDRASEAPKGHAPRLQLHPPPAKMLTLYGENFNKSEPPHVFFGSEPSSYVEVRCTEVLGCLPPDIETAKRRPIILVRQDGVVFPSSTMYP